MLENTDQCAIALKNWIIFRNTNFLYKGTVKSVINKWQDPDKGLVNRLLKSLCNQQMSKCWSEVERIYTDMLPKVMPNHIGVFSSFVEIKHDFRSAIFTATMNEQDIIIKAYPTIIPNINLKHEIIMLRKLYEKGLNVPKPYDSFETEHYTCLPMEKLEHTLINILEVGDYSGMKLICDILMTCIPILKVIHDSKLLYVDFSLGNICFKDKTPYMIDFGSMHWINVSFAPMAKTIRYCSINALNEKPVNEKDDFESLGFVLLEAYYGVHNSPLDKQTDKIQLIQECCDGKHGQFFQDYFQLIDADYDRVLQLTQQYNTFDF